MAKVWVCLPIKLTTNQYYYVYLTLIDWDRGKQCDLEYISYFVATRVCPASRFEMTLHFRNSFYTILYNKMKFTLLSVYYYSLLLLSRLLRQNSAAIIASQPAHTQRRTAMFSKKTYSYIFGYDKKNLVLLVHLQILLRFWDIKITIS